MFNIFQDNEEVESAEDVLQQLNTETPVDVILNEIDRSITAAYHEGKKAGELGKEENQTNFFLLVGVTALTGINTVILALQAFGYV